MSTELDTEGSLTLSEEVRPQNRTTNRKDSAIVTWSLKPVFLVDDRPGSDHEPSPPPKTPADHRSRTSHSKTGRTGRRFDRFTAIRNSMIPFLSVRLCVSQIVCWGGEEGGEEGGRLVGGVW